MYAIVCLGSVVGKRYPCWLACDTHTAILHYRRATLWIRSAPHVCHVHRANFLIHLVLQFLGAVHAELYKSSIVCQLLKERKHIESFWRLQRVYQQSWDLFIIIHTNPIWNIWICCLLFRYLEWWKLVESCRIYCDSVEVPTPCRASVCSAWCFVLVPWWLRSVKTAATASSEPRRHGDRYLQWCRSAMAIFLCSYWQCFSMGCKK